MESLHKWLQAILMLELITTMVSTPEMREQWRRDSDWSYHASHFTD